MPTQSNEEHISNNELYDMLKAIIKQNENIKEELKSFKTEIKNELLDIRQKNRQLELENIAIKERLIASERKLKKYNVVLYGLNEDEEIDILEQVVDLFNSKLKVKCKKEDIRDAYRMGKKVDEVERPIVVELLAVQLKNKLFANAHSLKGTNIYISPDYIKEDLQKRKYLQRNLKEARRRNLSAKIRNQALVVEGKVYTYEELLNTPISELDFVEEVPQEKDRHNTRNRNKKKPNN